MKIPGIVIYDLDGTLVDSAGVVAKILNEMRNENHLEPLSIEKVRLLTATGGEAMIQSALGCSGDLVAENLREFREKYKLTPTPRDLIFPGVEKTLRYLKNSGSFLALCTNKPKQLALNTLKETNLKQFFDYSVYYEQFDHNKPHPRPLNKIIEYFDEPKSNCIFIGDTETDFLASQRAGIQFIFYDSGYDLNLRKKHDLIKISHHKHLFIL